MRKLANDQQGLVAIIISMLLMIILSLIVLGFATNTRREQRQSLDRQLNARAYYAAESGINDAREYIKEELAIRPDVPLTPFTECTGAGPSSFTFKPREIEPGLSYPCLLINPTPPSIEYGSILPSGSVAFPVISATPGPVINELTISWQHNDKSLRDYAGCSAPASFPALAGWPPSCTAGMLRIDLAPAGNADRDFLIDNTKSFILNPVNGIGITTSGMPTYGQVIPVNCAKDLTAATPKDCNFKVSGLAASGYYMRVRPIYRPISLYVTGQAGSSFKGAQAIVDSTGKASDVLKRLQVRLSINQLDNDRSTIFGYGIQSVDSICKRYSIVPGATPKVTTLETDTSCLAPGP